MARLGRKPCPRDCRSVAAGLAAAGMFAFAIRCRRSCIHWCYLQHRGETGDAWRGNRSHSRRLVLLGSLWPARCWRAASCNFVNYFLDDFVEGITAGLRSSATVYVLVCTSSVVSPQTRDAMPGDRGARSPTLITITRIVVDRLHLCIHPLHGVVDVAVVDGARHHQWD